MKISSFKDCESLEGNIELLEGTTIIEAQTFACCQKIENIQIPKSVKEICKRKSP